MIKCLDAKGRTAYLGTPQMLIAIITWCRGFLTLAYGEEEAERRLRALPARQVLDLWVSKDAQAVLHLDWAS